jgi:hypothetical protein
MKLKINFFPLGFYSYKVYYVYTFNSTPFFNFWNVAAQYRQSNPLTSRLNLIKLDEMFVTHLDMGAGLP